MVVAVWVVGFTIANKKLVEGVFLPRKLENANCAWAFGLAKHNFFSPFLVFSRTHKFWKMVALAMAHGTHALAQQFPK